MKLSAKCGQGVLIFADVIYGRYLERLPVRPIAGLDLELAPLQGTLLPGEVGDSLHC